MQLEAKRAELLRVEEELQSTERERQYNLAMLDVAREREQRLRPVMDIIARADYEQAANEVLAYGNAAEQNVHKLGQFRHQQSQIRSEISSIIESFRSTTLKEYADRQKQATEIRAEIDKTSFRNEKQRIVSPCDGYVASLYVHTIGGVVTPAQKLMAVVPIDAPLIVKAVVLNKDIGFIKEGMATSIKVDTFDFQKYGTIQGTVRNISKHSTDDDKLGPVYEVFIQPSEMHLTVDGRRQTIKSGMSLTAEIKVGQRKIIEFFVYPLIKYLDEGIKVR